MEDLTRRQQQVLALLQKKIRDNGVPPSIREIGRELQISSLRGVTCHLEALEKKGYLRRLPHARGLRLLAPAEKGKKTRVQKLTVDTSGRAGFSVPLLGRVAAGQPVLAQENREGSLTVDPLFAREENCFALRVSGDSMIEAGILNGDYVIVRRQQTAENGDIVVALIDEEATVKRFYREGKRIRLQPANAALQAIFLSPEQVSVALLGKVVGLLRAVR